MNHAGSSAHSRLDNFLVGIFLSLHLHVLIERCCAEPKVGIVAWVGGLLVNVHTGHVLQQFFVQGLHVLVVGNVVG